eukprot:Rhum_TRINITY_DN6117_c0_g1::Rhum_TRINITY_DN6117_c0_g1_i1::g.19186::m.19186
MGGGGGGRGGGEVAELSGGGGAEAGAMASSEVVSGPGNASGAPSPEDEPSMRWGGRWGDVGATQKQTANAGRRGAGKGHSNGGNCRLQVGDVWMVWQGEQRC